ncbi:MAG: cobalamin-dependent protein, partial [Rubrivivax sp.]|nr:cobalamin-dependent protein [Rubrivivax sp.]
DLQATRYGHDPQKVTVGETMSEHAVCCLEDQDIATALQLMNDHHLDFLRPTLETDDLSPFLAYLGWWTQVLASRGLTQLALQLALDELASFFIARLGNAALPIAAALGAGRAALAQGISAPTYDKPCPVCHDEALPYARAALLGERVGAMALLEAALAREDSLPQVAVHVIQPAMYEVGRRWQENIVSVAQEHLATALSQTWMARARALATAAPDNGGRVLFACLAGNHHVMGLRMVADAFELDGWATHSAGPDTSLAALLAKVRQIRPHLVGFSVSLPQHLRGVRDAVAGLRAELGRDCPRLVVGGLVINQFPGLADWVGAEVLGADAVTAAAAALAGLTGHPH